MVSNEGDDEFRINVEFHVSNLKVSRDDNILTVSFSNLNGRLWNGGVSLYDFDDLVEPRYSVYFPTGVYDSVMYPENDRNFGLLAAGDDMLLYHQSVENATLQKNQKPCFNEFRAERDPNGLTSGMDVDSPTDWCEYYGFTKPINCLEQNPQHEDVFLLTDKGGSIKILQASTPEELSPKCEVPDRQLNLCCTKWQSESTLVTSTSSGSLYTLSVNDQTVDPQLTQIYSSPTLIKSFQPLPTNPETIIAISPQGSLETIDTKERKSCGSIPLGFDAYYGGSACAVSQCGGFVAFGSDAGHVGVVDLRMNRVLCLQKRHHDVVSCLCWHPTSRGVLFSGSYDKQISMVAVDEIVKAAQ